MAETQGDTIVKPAPELTEPGDHDRMAHYARKSDITAAAIEGTPCIALCGKVWVPTRTPDKFPVCPECKEIYEGMKP